MSIVFKGEGIRSISSPPLDLKQKFLLVLTKSEIDVVYILVSQYLRVTKTSSSLSIPKSTFFYRMKKIYKKLNIHQSYSRRLVLYIMATTVPENVQILDQIAEELASPLVTKTKEYKKDYLPYFEVNKV